MNGLVDHDQQHSHCWPVLCCAVLCCAKLTGLQGWEDVSSDNLQICAACNLPWLDTTFRLAPEAQLNSGMPPPCDYIH